MEPISLKEYADECRTIARDAVAECHGVIDEVYDHIHQTIDGHQWIIYTYYNAFVLAHTSNEDAYFEDMGKLEADSYSDAMMKMAFAAMLQDVQQHVSDEVDAYREEHPEADEDEEVES